MADLGLSALSDDQLLELLQEACGELGQRDPVVRNLAQKTIYSEAERLAVYKRSIETAVKVAKADYEQSVRRDVEQAITEDVRMGRWKPLDSSEEAALVVQEDRRMKQVLVAEAQKALASPSGPTLWLHIQPGCVKASFQGPNGQRQTQSVGRVSQPKIERLIESLKATLEV